MDLRNVNDFVDRYVDPTKSRVVDASALAEKILREMPEELRVRTSRRQIIDRVVARATQHIGTLTS